MVSRIVKDLKDDNSVKGLKDSGADFELESVTYSEMCFEEVFDLKSAPSNGGRVVSQVSLLWPSVYLTVHG